MRSLRLFIATTVCLLAVPAEAEETRAAVASNFLLTFQLLAKDFSQQTQQHLVIISGSSGKLFAQIQHGAPFDLFFSADQERPKILGEAGLGIPDSRFPYALGRLTLWGSHSKLDKDNGVATLAKLAFTHLAIANPKTAPYGRAAEQALRALDLWDIVKPRLVYGENIAQAYQFVRSGNAQLGFLALTQVLSSQSLHKHARWDVPATLHDPILQEAILLKHGMNNKTARDFLAYVKSPAAKTIIKQQGYGIPKPHPEKIPQG